MGLARLMNENILETTQLLVEMEYLKLTFLCVCDRD